MKDFNLLKDYLDGQFDLLSQRLDDSTDKIKSLSENVNDINKTLVRLTQTVEVHEKRSTNLEKEIRPLREEFLAKKIIKQYKLSRKKELMQRYKIPMMILTGLSGTAFFWDWLVHLSDNIKNLFK